MPYALSEPSFATFSSPFTYLLIFVTDSSQVFLASGLKANIAGFITGRNLSSITLPLYSVTELCLV